VPNLAQAFSEALRRQLNDLLIPGIWTESGSSWQCVVPASHVTWAASSLERRERTVSNSVNVPLAFTEVAAIALKGHRGLTGLETSMDATPYAVPPRNVWSGPDKENRVQMQDPFLPPGAAAPGKLRPLE
jgi:hypothetical protein